MAVFKNRFLVLGMGSLVLICIGVLYAWSVFIPALEEEFACTRSEVSFVFSLSMVMWSIGMLLNAGCSRFMSLRVRFLWGAGLTIAGFGVSTCAHSIALLYVSYGVLCGLGIGFVYNLWMTYVLSLFPERVGTVSGILLLGFGVGSLILGFFASLVLPSLGWRGAFWIIAGIMSLVFLCALPFLKGKQGGRQKERSSVRKHTPIPQKTSHFSCEDEALPMIKQPSFWTFTVWKVFVMASMAALIAQASVIMLDTGAPSSFMMVAVGAISTGNGGGRFFAGVLFDLVGEKKMLIGLSLACLMVAGGMLVAYMVKASFLLAVFFFLEGLLYGSYANINTSFIRSAYGQRSLSMNMGISSFTLMPFNLLFPVLSAFVFDVTGSYALFLFAMPVIALVSLCGGRATGHFLEKIDGRAQKGSHA